MTDKDRLEIIELLTSENTGDLVQCMHDYGVQKYNEAINDVSGSLPSESEIQKYIDDQPYYGTCTTEYKEGIEQGIKWVLDRLKVVSNER